MSNTKTTWTFESYWNVVFGDRSTFAIIQAFDLVNNRHSLSEWLDKAEAEAWCVGRQKGSCVDAWGKFHDRAVDMLSEAFGSL